MGVPQRNRFTMRSHTERLKDFCRLLMFMFDSHRFESITQSNSAYFKIAISVSDLIVDCTTDIIQFLRMQHALLDTSKIVWSPSILDDSLKVDEIIDFIFPSFTEENSNLVKVVELKRCLEVYGKRQKFKEYESHYGDDSEESKLYENLSDDEYDDFPEFSERYFNNSIPSILVHSSFSLTFSQFYSSCQNQKQNVTSFEMVCCEIIIFRFFVLRLICFSGLILKFQTLNKNSTNSVS
jgi:hypothetical protein